MRAVVSGAAGGIGAAVTAALRARGTEVIEHDLRFGDDAPGGVRVESDLRTEEGLRALAQAVGDEPLDQAFAAHGIEGSGAITAIGRDRSRLIMEVDFLSVVRMFEHLERSLTRGASPQFVLVSSQAGLVGEANNAAYCAAKFALVGWARAMAAHPAIAVRALCPGCVNTPLLRGAFEGMARDEGIELAAMVARREAAIPAGHLAAPEEIAHAALLLAGLGSVPLPVLGVTGGEVLW